MAAVTYLNEEARVASLARIKDRRRFAVVVWLHQKRELYAKEHVMLAACKFTDQQILEFNQWSAQDGSCLKELEPETIGQMAYELVRGSDGFEAYVERELAGEAEAAQKAKSP